MSSLVVDTIVHDYGDSRTLNGVSFHLQAGDIGCLMGPSGSGKTTVLLCIAGLERLTSGSISFGGRLLSAAHSHLPPEKRRVGMVFQDFALFPHLSAHDNVAFGVQGVGAVEKNKQVDEVLSLCDLRNHADAFPHQLSGGEQQRVALARALITKPDLLLLDEPFSRLDAALYEKISGQVRDILKSRNQTTLLVTHNQNEAFLLADVGGVIVEGGICQWDSVDDLYHRPSCALVADFVGDGALLEGVMRSDGGVDTALGILRGAAAPANPLLRPGEAVKILLRPDDVAINGDDGGVLATVEKRAFRGATTLYFLRLANGERVMSVLPSRYLYEINDSIGVSAQLNYLTLFPSLERAV